MYFVRAHNFCLFTDYDILFIATTNYNPTKLCLHKPLASNL